TIFATTMGTVQDLDFSGSGLDGVTQPSDLVVTINWGDGSATTPGLALFDPVNPVFDIVAIPQHIYARAGTFTATVTVQESFDGAATSYKTSVVVNPSTNHPLKKDPVIQLVPVPQSNGLPALFAVNSANLGEYQTSTAGNVWSPWVALPAFNTITQISVGLNK